MFKVSRGQISTGGRTIAVADLPQAVAQMKQAGVSAVVLITTRSATVQDVVSTLEALKVAEFSSVTLLNRSGGEG